MSKVLKNFASWRQKWLLCHRDVYAEKVSPHRQAMNFIKFIYFFANAHVILVYDNLITIFFPSKIWCLLYVLRQKHRLLSFMLDHKFFIAVIVVVIAFLKLNNMIDGNERKWVWHLSSPTLIVKFLSIKKSVDLHLCGITTRALRNLEIKIMKFFIHAKLALFELNFCYFWES